MSAPGASASNKENMNKTRTSLSLLASASLVLAAAPPAASADGYQFIISGDPVAAATADTDYDVSAGTSLAVGLLGGNSASGALEARRMTIGDSDGTALDSTELKAMVIILR